MVTEYTDTDQFAVSFVNTTNELLEVLERFDPVEINDKVKSSLWTAGQVTEHVCRSIRAISKALKSGGQTVERNPGERIQEMKKMFLDFTAKYTSPPFALPTSELYDKQKLISELKAAIFEFNNAAKQATLNDAITDDRLGILTKHELMYLALYHTQRHIRQLRNIHENHN